MSTKFTLPVGYCQFHPKQLFNFQLNRWYSLGYLPYEAMVAAGKKISDFATWRREMQALAEEALGRGRLTEAAFFYRAQEFYTIPPQAGEVLSERFSDLFYRVFTRPESAENHCQIGNVGLALNTMEAWISSVQTQRPFVNH